MDRDQIIRDINDLLRGIPTEELLVIYEEVYDKHLYAKIAIAEIWDDQIRGTTTDTQKQVQLDSQSKIARHLASAIHRINPKVPASVYRKDDTAHRLANDLAREASKCLIKK